MTDEPPFVLFAKGNKQKEYYLYITKKLKNSDLFVDIEPIMYQAIDKAVGTHYGTICGFIMPRYMLLEAGYPNKGGNRVITTPFGECPLITIDSPSTTIPEKVCIKIKVPQLEFTMIKKYLMEEYPSQMSSLFTKDYVHNNMELSIDVFNSIPNLTRYYHLL